MKTVLITGCNGLLGSKLCAAALDRYHIVGLDIHPHALPLLPDIIYHRGDITRPETAEPVFSEYRPWQVIHTAAFTEVDGCERDHDRAWQVNVTGAANMAALCRRYNAGMVHISTDYVFNGENGPYTEEDPPNPISWYGRTKLESETAVRDIMPDAVICRTTVLYGHAPGTRPNFVSWLVSKLDKGESVKIVADQYGSPTLADDLAAAIILLMNRKVSGIFNTVGPDCINRLQFARMIVRAFDLDPSLLGELESSRLMQAASRPSRGGLKTDKIVKSTGFAFSTVADGLRKMRAQMEKDGWSSPVEISERGSR